MKPTTYTLTVYKAADGHRWRMRSGNGRIVADSGEGYSSERAALRAAQRLATARLVVRLEVRA